MLIRASHRRSRCPRLPRSPNKVSPLHMIGSKTLAVNTNVDPLLFVEASVVVVVADAVDCKHRSQHPC